MSKTRKFIVVLFLAVLAFIMFILSPRDLSCLIATIGFYGILAKLYNDANIKEHEIENGGVGGK